MSDKCFNAMLTHWRSDRLLSHLLLIAQQSVKDDSEDDLSLWLKHQEITSVAKVFIHVV